METEDVIKLPASSNSEHGSEDDIACESGSEAINSESLPLNSEVLDEIHGEAPRDISGVLDENMDALMEDDFEKGSNSATQPVAFELTNSIADVEKVVSASSVHSKNGLLSVQSEITFSNLKKNETISSRKEIDANSLSGVKRPRLALDEQQPSVHVIYSSLPRESKQKLEKLLEEWSKWHSHRCPSSDDANVVLESGEETFYPALNVGVDKPSSITFRVDNQTEMRSSKEFKQLDSTSVPLYDRGYSLVLTSADGSSGLDGGSEMLDTSRCFNCGSYSHALRDCTKPRDNVAVSNARKQHNSKRNQHANSRNSIRYYQSSRGGKYDDLTPGMLNEETRKALGLGELDPPPWLNRMREIGYPPGYLEADIEDQPSGITIFGDDSYKDESEEGEILGASQVEPSRKMSVKFPGINAPVPENADGKLWSPSNSSVPPSRYSSHQRYNQPTENSSRGYHSEQRGSREWDDTVPENADGRLWTPNHSSFPSSRYSSHQRYNIQPSEYSSRGEPRWRREWDDEGPPGCEPGTSPSLSNHFHRYGDVDYGYRPLSPRASPSTPWSSSSGRPSSDGGRRSPRIFDGSPKYGSYNSPR